MVIQRDPLVHLFPSLGELDVTNATIELQLWIVTLGFVSDMALFFVSYLFFMRFETFRLKLHLKDKVLWCVWFIRVIYGFIGFFFGFWYVVLDDTLHRDVVNAVSGSSFISLHIFIGYFVFENVALFLPNIVLSSNFSKDPTIAPHHILTLLVGSAIAMSGKGHYFAMIALLLQQTTPFSCVSWVLLKAKKSHLLLWKVNQCALVHVFFCSMMAESYTIFVIYFQWDNMSTNMPGMIHVFVCMMPALMLSTRTPHCTYKAMKKLFIDCHHPQLQTGKAVSNSHMNGISNKQAPRIHDQ